MKKMVGLLLIGIVLSSVSGCNSGVSKEEYEKLVAERDALQEQLGISSSNVEDITDETKNDDSTKKDKQNTGTFDEKTVLSQLKVTQYSYEIYGNPYVFLIVDNTSDFNLNIGAELKAYDSSGNIIAAKDTSQEAVESKTQTILKFLLDEKFEKIEYELSADIEDYYTCIISDLSYESNSAKDKEIVTVTNNGQNTAKYVEANVLFFKGEELVYYNSEYFVDDDSELKAGDSITKEVYCSEEYDSFQIYFTGRA